MSCASPSRGASVPHPSPNDPDPSRRPCSCDAEPHAKGPRPASCACAGRASTTSRTSTSTFRATRWSSSPACRARASRRWRSARSTRRRSGAISNRSRRTRGACSTRWRVPEVDEIDGLPPAVALQQQRGSPTTRSSVGSVTTLSNLLRMLYSRAGDYPRGQPLLVRRVVLAEHAGGRLSRVPRARPRLRGDRARRWCRTTR